MGQVPAGCPMPRGPPCTPSWFESPHDRELFKVIPLLDRLLEAEDVRPALRQRFRPAMRFPAVRTGASACSVVFSQLFRFQQ